MHSVRLFALSLAAASLANAVSAAPLAHSVFFALKEDTPENRKLLVAACEKHLTKHEGEVFFGVGTLAEELQRDVNDRDFDVALHIVFDGRESHDKYQTHPRHLEFIRQVKPTLASVRVFDAYLVTTPAD